LFRQQIVFRFHKGMNNVVTFLKSRTPEQPMPEIYVVAHSEGTVVSFLAMLQAMSAESIRDPEKPMDSPIGTAWIQHVKGFMTIGSPIDKHLILWPGMWQKLQLSSERQGKRVRLSTPARKDPLVLEGPIQWRNYFDLGDPVGFRLDTARAFLEEKHCVAFEFEERHDIGFTRYLFPRQGARRLLDRREGVRAFHR
jgi:hypothetical protein